jgi:hypothetical protein
MSTKLNRTITIVAILAISTLAGCASSGAQQSAATRSLPTWVTAPYIEEGFIDTQCVTNNAPMGTLKTKAVTQARAELAKQIEVQVKAMDKAFTEMTEEGDVATYGSSFESVTKQVTSKALVGTRATKVEYVDFPDGSQQLCALVEIRPDIAKKIYAQIMDESGRELSPEDDAVIWQEFMALKAQEELDADLDAR